MSKLQTRHAVMQRLPSHVIDVTTNILLFSSTVSMALQMVLS